MTQEQALLILKTGANVFLTGEPGAGKTYTINKYIAYLKEHHIDHSITASTGIAATHVGGMTIHSWSGIGIKEFLSKYDLDKISTSEYLTRRIVKTKVLIIDEISMLHSNTLSMVDMVCRLIRQNDEPFGGLQVIFVGDFFQLPPINKKSNREESKKEKEIQLFEEEEVGDFAYQSPAWLRASPVICYIHEQHRQDDDDFLDLLLSIRRGTLEGEHLDYLKSRFVKREEFPPNVTKLFSHNLDVDRVNGDMLSKIQGVEKKFLMNSTGKDNIVATLKKGCLSPEVLVLKKGAIVMCTKNNPKERYVNGTLGEVIDFDSFSGNPIIRTISGSHITITPLDWSIEDNGKIKAKISQIPLRLAWAITVHKSQGMSMDSAIMDLSSVFEYGQGYVALSRVRRMSGLYLLGFNDMSLKVHPEILEQDNDFREASEKAVELFCNIPNDEMKKMHKNFVVAMGGKWTDKKTTKINKTNKNSDSKNNTESDTSDYIEDGEYQEHSISKLDKIREKHTNAYKKWTIEEEEKVVSDFKKGKSIKEIASINGRQVGGIRARLIKLGLIEDDRAKVKKDEEKPF